MFGTLVCIFSLISTKPRSLILTPTSSSPNPLELGRNPIAISAWSASRVVSLPSADTLTLTPLSVASTDSTLFPTRHLMPRFSNSFLSSFETSSSSSGTRRGSISTIVTSIPYEFHTVRAGANYGHRLGQFLLQDGLEIGDNLFTVHFPSSGHRRARARRHDDV